MVSKKKELKRMNKRCKSAWAKYMNSQDRMRDTTAFTLPPVLD